MRRMFTTEDWNQNVTDSKIVITPFRGGEIIASNTNEVGFDRGPFFIYIKYNEKWVEMTPGESKALSVYNDIVLEVVLDVMKQESM